MNIKLYTTQEVADITRLSIYTVRSKVQRGEFGNVCNFGRANMITQEGLDAYIKEHTGLPKHRTIVVSFGRRKPNLKAAKL